VCVSLVRETISKNEIVANCNVKVNRAEIASGVYNHAKGVFKQNKTKQNKAKQSKTKQNKAKQSKTKQKKQNKQLKKSHQFKPKLDRKSPTA
jgi:hypothetical protein